MNPAANIINPNIGVAKNPTAENTKTMMGKNKPSTEPNGLATCPIYPVNCPINTLLLPP